MNPEEDYNIAARYRTVRKHLDDFGYRHALSLDALPLIEKLLADLIQTTESLKHFKNVAQDNIEACSQLQLAVEPYKCDNARLVQECNQLHLDLLEAKDSFQRQARDLKKQLYKVESECNDLQLASSRNLRKIKELETESSKKSKKILELQGKCCKPVISNTNLANKKRACFPLRRPILECDPLPRIGSSSTVLPNLSKVEPRIIDLMNMADHRMNCLNREVIKLKGELSLQTDNIDILRIQLATKEKEILRLKKMLDGGRPFSAVSKDCWCNKIDKSHVTDNNEVRVLKQAKLDLEQQLKEALNKQHDAMSQAMKLAERNEELEKELRDIDHVALAVEADCNSAVQENNKRVSRLQEKLEDVMTQVHVLENELTVERREMQELRADLESSKLEKRNIQRVLESTLDEKKQMTDRINQLTVQEKKLSDELERLTVQCERQKDEIIELESANNLLKQQLHTKELIQSGDGDLKRMNEQKEKNDKIKGKKILKKKTASKNQQHSLVTQMVNTEPHKEQIESFKEDEVTRDMNNRVSTYNEVQKASNEKDAAITSLKLTIERLEAERDYYRNEYNKFREQFNKGSDRDNADLWTQTCELRRQLNEKEQAVAELQREKKELCREKFNLEARLQTSKTQQRRSLAIRSPCSPCRPIDACACSPVPASPNADVSATKALLERLERERDTARADVERLVEERDALRERLKMAVEAHTDEQRRLKESLAEVETRLKQLERERQDLMVTQGTRRATINGLEDQLEDMRQELRKTKEELTSQRTQYFQLRALQDQTDQALGDVQGQLSQSETELTKALERNRQIEQQQMQLDGQTKELKREISTLRTGMAQLDQEKDQLLMSLDEKTERIAALERELRSKDQQTAGVEQQVRELQHRNQICVDQNADQERQLRAMQLEIDNVQRQLSTATMDRENAIQENRRMQDDLAAVTCECRNLQRELEVSRAESHDLKRQLQTYVTEVRRAEDLLNRKENERTEMLNHFRSLSLEATVLENNNHSLESEAAEARGALQSASDRLLDLERQLADRDCLISGYETQISDLTQSVASMETQLRLQGDLRKRAEDDLNAVRDLCVQLDQQKEALVKQIGEKDAAKAQIEAQLSRLRADQNMVQDQMSRDQIAVDRMEALLAQARQESMDAEAKNQELRHEMSRLRQKIAELQDKLSTESADLQRYQNQAAEYSKQISELRRQMTNERFDRARKEEENRRTFQPSPSTSFPQHACPPCSPLQVPTPAPRPNGGSSKDWTAAPEPARNSERAEDSTRDLRSEAQRTNRFNAVTDYGTTCCTSCSCKDNSFKSSNVVPVQRECPDVPCINIILNPDKSAREDKEIQIVEVPVTTQNRGRTAETASPAVFNPVGTSTMNTLQNNVTLGGNNISTINNTSHKQSENHNSFSPFPHYETFNHSHNNANRRTIQPVPILTGPNNVHFLPNEASTFSDSRRSEAEMSFGSLSEKIQKAIRTLHSKSDNFTPDSFHSATSGRFNRTPDEIHDVTRHDPNTNSSSFREPPIAMPNLNETRQDTTGATLSTNAPSLHLPMISNTYSSVHETNASIRTNADAAIRKPPSIIKDAPSEKHAELCFCNGPDVTPCGTSIPLTRKEISEVPMEKRLNDNCNCKCKIIAEKAIPDHHLTGAVFNESRLSKKKQNNEGKTIEPHAEKMQVDCCTNTDDQTSGYSSTSSIRKIRGKNPSKVTKTKSVKNLTKNKRAQTKTKKTTTAKGETNREEKPVLLGNTSSNMALLLKKALEDVEKRGDDKSETELHSVEIGTEEILEDFVNGPAIDHVPPPPVEPTGEAQRNSDLTRSEFIRMLTEIKEHTLNLEKELATMNDTMKSKRVTTVNANPPSTCRTETRVPVQGESEEINAFIGSNDQCKTSTLRKYNQDLQEDDSTEHFNLPNETHKETVKNVTSLAVDDLLIASQFPVSASTPKSKKENMKKRTSEKVRTNEKTDAIEDSSNQRNISGTSILDLSLQEHDSTEYLSLPHETESTALGNAQASSNRESTEPNTVMCRTEKNPDGCSFARMNDSIETLIPESEHLESEIGRRRSIDSIRIDTLENLDDKEQSSPKSTQVQFNEHYIDEENHHAPEIHVPSLPKSILKSREDDHSKGTTICVDCQSSNKQIEAATSNAAINLKSSPLHHFEKSLCINDATKSEMRMRVESQKQDANNRSLPLSHSKKASCKRQSEAQNPQQITYIKTSKWQGTPFSNSSETDNCDSEEELITTNYTSSYNKKKNRSYCADEGESIRIFDVDSSTRDVSSPQQDPKCTIRVTVALNETPSDETMSDN